LNEFEENGGTTTKKIGPPASGKYSQMLYLVRRYSPSALKHEKKVSFVNEKQTYNRFMFFVFDDIILLFLNQFYVLTAINVQYPITNIIMYQFPNQFYCVV
jgi:hypothetical protein